jgi:hypothetical protein
MTAMCIKGEWSISTKNKKVSVKFEFEWNAVGRRAEYRCKSASDGHPKQHILNKKRKGLTKKERLPAKLKSALVHISSPTLRKKNKSLFLLKDFGPKKG